MLLKVIETAYIILTRLRNLINYNLIPYDVSIFANFDVSLTGEGVGKRISRDIQILNQIFCSLTGC